MENPEFVPEKKDMDLKLSKIIEILQGSEIDNASIVRLIKEVDVAFVNCLVSNTMVKEPPNKYIAPQTRQSIGSVNGLGLGFNSMFIQ